MGASINGLGTDTITKEGREKLSGISYTAVFDRIEFGTYAVAAVVTNGSLLIRRCREKVSRYF